MTRALSERGVLHLPQMLESTRWFRGCEEFRQCHSPASPGSTTRQGGATERRPLPCSLRTVGLLRGVG